MTATQTRRSAEFTSSLPTPDHRSGKMGTMKLLALAALILSVSPTHACGEEAAPPIDTHLTIALDDGSIIKARAIDELVTLSPLNIQTSLPLKWSLIRKIEAGPDDGLLQVHLANEDILSARWTALTLKVECAFGIIDLPTHLIAGIRPRSGGQERTNIALGKPVTGQDGASHGKGLAKHVTDGDHETHAKPPASNFDYTIDLREPDTPGFSVSGLKIDWGYFGDRFKGVPAADGNGWSSGGWPGDYVTSYEVLYRSADADEWIALHHGACRPADEEGEDVTVEKLPTEVAGCSSEVTTTVEGLNLSDVAEIRIKATGSHWIGLFELEVFGSP